MGGRRRSTASTARADAPRLRDRHAAADRQRIAARRPRVLLHAHRRHRALPAHARQAPCSIRWAGTTTGCRPSGACRTTTACAAIRRCRTTRRSRRRPTPAKPPISISRPNFVELCARLTAEDEKAFEHLWRHLGLSVDWSLTYATIGRPAQRVSQLAFLRLLARRRARISSKRRRSGTSTSAPRSRRPSSKIARCRARTIAIRFAREAGGGAHVEIDTTRPELIPACVALVAHPDDPRYQPLFGRDVLTPLFGVPGAGAARIRWRIPRRAPASR